MTGKRATYKPPKVKAYRAPKVKAYKPPKPLSSSKLLRKSRLKLLGTTSGTSAKNLEIQPLRQRQRGAVISKRDLSH